MHATQNPSRHSNAVARLAQTHARHMFLYYFLRAQLETPGVIGAEEREAVHAAAVESRRFGFRMESTAEKAGLMLDGYDEEGLRREAYRAAQVVQTDETAAREIEERVVTETAHFALSPYFSVRELDEVPLAA
ncbi:MAG: hypothetical protein ACJ74Q_14980 [Pyrinomonadaceae bacterium]